MSRVTWFLLLISLWVCLITVVVFFNGNIRTAQRELSYFIHQSEFTNLNSADDFLRLMPNSSVIHRMKSCISCNTPEIYAQKCIAALEEPAPSPFLGKTRRDILEEARKKSPSGTGSYPPITGFFNIVINADSYIFPWKYGDPVALIQLGTIIESGLLDHASLHIRVGVTFSRRRTSDSQVKVTKRLFESQIKLMTKGATHGVRITYWDPKQYECDTINTLKKHCQPPEMKDSLVFYLHNKGKSRESNGWEYVNVRHWREYMMFFLFERWELCVNSLAKGLPTCGVDLKWDSQGINPHYSGNFWWARCDWISIKNVECPLGIAARSLAEFWVLRDPSGDFRNGSRPDDREHEAARIPKMAVTLWNTHIDHYHKQMPRAEYACSDKIQYP